MGKAISLMKQHGFHEPTDVHNRARNETLLKAREMGIETIDDQKIQEMSGQVFSGWLMSLRSEIRAHELAESVRWQDIVSENAGIKFRVRAVVAEKEVKNLRAKIKLLESGDSASIRSLYAAERDHLVETVTKLRSELETEGARLASVEAENVLLKSELEKARGETARHERRVEEERIPVDLPVSLPSRPEGDSLHEMVADAAKAIRFLASGYELVSPLSGWDLPYGPRGQAAVARLLAEMDRWSRIQGD